MPDPIVACILSRDEPELLRENVLHLIHNEGIHHIIVTNHVSIDANRAVMEEFKDVVIAQFDELKPLPLLQNEWRTRMCRYAIRQYKASWLLCIDTDEFWHNLQQLHNVPRKYNSVRILRVYDHFGTRLDPDGPYLPANMPWHKGRRFHGGKTAHRAISAKIKITRCSHNPVQPGGVITDPFDIVIHHYPVRDWERFLIKVNTANERNSPRHRRTVWRAMQKAGTLRHNWENVQQPPVEELEQLLADRKAGYFIPRTPWQQQSSSAITQDANPAP